MMNIRLFFSELKDHRQGMKVQHDLLEIIAMTLIAIAADCDGWDEIEDFCQQYEEWLKSVVGLTLQGGVPTADIMPQIPEENVEFSGNVRNPEYFSKVFFVSCHENAEFGYWNAKTCMV